MMLQRRRRRLVWRKLAGCMFWVARRGSRRPNRQAHLRTPLFLCALSLVLSLAGDYWSKQQQQEKKARATRGRTRLCTRYCLHELVTNKSHKLLPMGGLVDRIELM